MRNPRETIHGRFYGIWNVEGDDGPLALFASVIEAHSELARRQALPEDHDDRLDAYHDVFPCDVLGTWWNSYDPDPRAASPLGAEEIVACWQGER